MTETPTSPVESVAAGLQEGTWHPLPEAAASAAGLVGGLTGLVPGMVLAGLAGGWVPGAWWLRLCVGLLVLLLVPMSLALLARVRVRRVRWCLDARGLYVCRGLLWRHEILVPRSRVQHLDIERGPVERHFGLATLIVHTAGTRMHALRQAGFNDAEAVALRDILVPEARRHDDAL